MWTGLASTVHSSLNARVMNGETSAHPSGVYPIVPKHTNWYAWFVNKTIYIRDEDAAVWDRARELAGDKLSPVIVASLKKFIAEKEAESVPELFARIVLTFSDSKDHYIPKAKAFIGKWIVPLNENFPIGHNPDDGDTYYSSLAVTPKGKVVVFSWTIDAATGSSYQEDLAIYDSIHEAMSSEDSSIAKEAYERMGVPVEELDI
jgi:hypothetical protein